jgi:hypothetical protein
LVDDAKCFECVHPEALLTFKVDKRDNWRDDYPRYEGEVTLENVIGAIPEHREQRDGENCERVNGYLRGLRISGENSTAEDTVQCKRIVWELSDCWIFEGVDEAVLTILRTERYVINAKEAQPALAADSTQAKPGSGECIVKGCFELDVDSTCATCGNMCHFYCAHLTYKATTCFNCREE